MPELLGDAEPPRCWQVPSPELAPFEPKPFLGQTFPFCPVGIPCCSWAGAPAQKNPSLTLLALLLR